MSDAVLDWDHPGLADHNEFIAIKAPVVARLAQRTRTRLDELSPPR